MGEETLYLWYNGTNLKTEVGVMYKPRIKVVFSDERLIKRVEYHRRYAWQERFRQTLQPYPG